MSEAPKCACGECWKHSGICGRCNRALDDHILADGKGGWLKEPRCTRLVA